MVMLKKTDAESVMYQTQWHQSVIVSVIIMVAMEYVIPENNLMFAVYVMVKDTQDSVIVKETLLTVI